MKQEGIKQIIIIVVACVIVTSFQLFSILTKKTITDDEGISYIAATGHQAIYNNNRPKGIWIEASEWKKLWNPDQKFCFKTIGNDIAKLDIHPPLYFWCLHVWLLAVGTSTITGPILNLLFFILTFCLILKAGKRVLNSFNLALGSAIVWGISSSVLEYVKEARQYTLLALFTITMLHLILTLLQSTKKHNWSIYIAISAISVMGMLTHYYYSLLIISAFLVIWLTAEKKTKWPLLIRYVIAEIFAAFLFIVLHPMFLASFQRQQQQAQSFLMADILSRIKTTITTFTSFYFPGIFTKPAFIIAVIIVIAILIIFYKKQYLRQRYWMKIRAEQKQIFIFFFFLLIGISSLYIGFISPEHAMRSKYLSMAHILIVYVTFILIGLINLKYQNLIITGLIIWQLALSFLFIRSQNISYTKTNIAESVKLNPQRILLDNEERGVVPTILWYFPDNTQVFAANQDSLIKNKEKWIDSLYGKTIYISDLDYGNTLEKRNHIKNLMISDGYRFNKTLTVKYNSTHEVYSLEKKSK